jgi:hypothetical protein
LPNRKGTLTQLRPPEASRKNITLSRKQNR